MRYVRFAVCAVVVCCMCMLFSYTLSFSRYNYLVVLVLVFQLFQLVSVVHSVIHCSSLLVDGSERYC